MATLTTTTAPITIPADVWGPRNDDRMARNEEKADAAGLAPCAQCGRGVKPGTSWQVVAVDGGNLLAVAQWAEVDESDSGFMGMWDLGPECGRKVPAAFRTHAVV